MLDFFDTLKIISRVPSPSGYEGALADKIAEVAARYVDEISRDALGNLIMHKRGVGARLMIAAHMDTIGMVATHYDENGFIRFGALGGLTVSDLHNTPICFTNGVRGVISYDTKTELKDRKLTNFYIDIGAKNAEDARKLVPLGTAAFFSGEPFMMGDSKVCAPYLDNRAGVSVLLSLLSQIEDCEYDLYFVFTAQEEVGLRGARCAAFSIEPQFAINIDVTDTGDLPESDTKMDIKLGDGAAIKIMDRSVLCHPKITAALQEVARNHDIKYQNEILTDGGTDTGEIHLSRGGVVSGGISIPTRYIHSPCEVCDLSDVNSAIALLKAALNEQIFF